MKKYVCDVCGWIYDPEVGDPEGGIAPGTEKKKHFLAFRIQQRPYDIKCFVCEPKIRIHERKSNRSSQELLRKMFEQYGFYSVISFGRANQFLKQGLSYFDRINDFYELLLIFQNILK